MGTYLVDIIAVGFFALEWLVYSITLEHTAYGRNGLSARMNAFREVWVRRMLDREARMVDMQIMASLQNGTAFFCCAPPTTRSPCSVRCRSTSRPRPRFGRSNASG
jgi:uncharacterized membrane protein